MPSTARRAAVAGLFYPDEPTRLRTNVDTLLAEAQARGPEEEIKALIVPHAGYVYSGPIAATAYGRLATIRDRVRRVAVLGPAHRFPIAGLAAPSVDVFETPLGPVKLDRGTIEELVSTALVSIDDRAHAGEHSIEVQLPFLQSVLDELALVPLVVGAASAEDVEAVIEKLWRADTLIVISSDLSHYHSYADARRMDEATTASIERLDENGLVPESACGRIPIQGMLRVARRRGLRAQTLDLRSSGDTAGSPDKVVGYGAYAFV